MEILIMYITTMVVGWAMNIGLSFRIVKDAAEYGYKFDIKRLKEIGEALKFDERTKFNRLLQLICPIIPAMQARISYDNNKEITMEQLRVAGVIEEMTKEEYNKYKENPTFLTAIQLNSDAKEIDNKELAEKLNNLAKKINDSEENEKTKELAKSISRFAEMLNELDEEPNKVVENTMTGDINGKEASFTYQILPDNDIKVVSSSGEASKYSLDDQKIMILQCLKQNYQDGIVEYGGKEGLIKNLKDTAYVQIKNVGKGLKISDEEKEKIADDLIERMIEIGEAESLKEESKKVYKK